MALRRHLHAKTKNPKPVNNRPTLFPENTRYTHKLPGPC